MAVASKVSGWRRRLAAVVVTLALAGGFGLASVAATPTSAPAQAASWQDCVNAGLNAQATYSSRSPWVFVSGATSYWGCASVIGWVNASRICWESQQWWGYASRGLVWSITGGRYTRC
jgi:hypothetical protein